MVALDVTALYTTINEQAERIKQLEAAMDAAEALHTVVIRANADEIADLEDERDDKDEELVSIWSIAGAPEGLSPGQAVESLCFVNEQQASRIAELARERDDARVIAEQLNSVAALLNRERDAALARAEAMEVVLLETCQTVPGDRDHPCWCQAGLLNHLDDCMRMRAALAAAAPGDGDE